MSVAQDETERNRDTRCCIGPTPCVCCVQDALCTLERASAHAIVEARAALDDGWVGDSLQANLRLLMQPQIRDEADDTPRPRFRLGQRVWTMRFRTRPELWWVGRVITDARGTEYGLWDSEEGARTPSYNAGRLAPEQDVYATESECLEARARELEAEGGAS